MKIAIGSDHAGFVLKEQIKEYLSSKGHQLNDFGTHDEKSVDYPDYGFAVGNSVIAKESDFGVVCCGSGIGISIATNKIKGIRCALLYNVEVAKLAKEHNDANVIAFGARYMDKELVFQMIDAYMSTLFQASRHTKRIEKITCFDEGR